MFWGYSRRSVLMVEDAAPVTNMFAGWERVVCQKGDFFALDYSVRLGC